LFVVLRGRRPRTPHDVPYPRDRASSRGSTPRTPFLQGQQDGTHGVRYIGHPAPLAREEKQHEGAEGQFNRRSMPRYGYPAQENQHRPSTCSRQQMKRHG
jgi:hypothetical protein